MDSSFTEPDAAPALILGATYRLRGGSMSRPLHASEHFPGRFTDGMHVWDADGVRSGCEPGGPMDLVVLCDDVHLRSLLRRAHDAMSRREPDGISETEWDQLVQDIEKEIGNG